jgi:hypothetical protein
MLHGAKLQDLLRFALGSGSIAAWYYLTRGTNNRHRNRLSVADDDTLRSHRGYFLELT